MRFKVAPVFFSWIPKYPKMLKTSIDEGCVNDTRLVNFIAIREELAYLRPTWGIYLRGSFHVRDASMQLLLWAFHGNHKKGLDRSPLASPITSRNYVLQRSVNLEGEGSTLSTPSFPPHSPLSS